MTANGTRNLHVGQPCDPTSSWPLRFIVPRMYYICWRRANTTNVTLLCVSVILTGLLELYCSLCEAFQAYVSSECEKKSEQIATLWN